MPTVRCPYCAEEIQAEAIKCKHCGTWLSAPPPRPGPHPPGSGPWAPTGWAELEDLPPTPPMFGMAGGGTRRVVRPRSGRMIAGVCAGLARWTDLDPTIVRILYVVADIFTGIFPGLILYLVLAIVIPPDDRDMSY